MAADRKQIIKRINQGFAENDLETVLSFCSADFVWTMVGDTTVKGKDAIREWMASMDPQPPRLTIHRIIADGDTVVTHGDMEMQQEQNGPWIPYTFCDIYRFAGDTVAELTAFMIRTDKSGAVDPTQTDAGQMAGAQR